MQMLGDDRNGVVTGKRRLPGEHLVEQRTQRVEVALRARRVAERLLGGQVGDGADQGAAADPGPPLGRRQPKVAEPRSPVVVDPDVGGLQVPVDDAARVGVLEGTGDVGRDVDGALDLEPAARGIQQRQHVATRHVAADDEGITGVLSGVEHGDDVRVVAELAHRLGLAPSPRLDCRRHPLGVEKGNRDLGVGGGVVGEIDPLAAPLPQKALDPVAAGDLARDVRGERLDRRLPARADRRPRINGRRGFDGEVAAAGVAEPSPFAVLVAAGRTPHGLD
jgi:hypothetical protein